MVYYKLLYYTQDPDGHRNCHCMNGFGHGYLLNEAHVLKAHLESQGYQDVQIVELRYIGD